MNSKSPRPVSRAARWLAVLAALASIAAACGGSSSSGTDAAADTEASDPGGSDTGGSENADATGDEGEGAESPDGETDDSGSSEPDAPPTPLPVGPVEIPDDPSVELTTLASIEIPVAITARPGSALLYVATKGGRVVAYEVGDDSAEQVADVLDVSDQITQGDEQGLLGLTFSPDGSRMYINATDLEGDTIVDEYLMDGDEADTDTRRNVITIDQPGPYHNGGHLEFGPDGYLYIAMGDGNEDGWDNGQDFGTLHGSILRIDPLGADPYAVPADNPYVDGGGEPEIFLKGVRNPWKIAFDRATGDLWVADVGLSTAEEINILWASEGGGIGTNLGWPLMEGTGTLYGDGPPPDYVAPQYTYGREEGCSITGGRVYRGPAIPELYGIYVFADFCTSQLWGLAASEEQGVLGRFDLGVGQNFGVAVIGEGPDGELYVGGFDNVIARIDPA